MYVYALTTDQSSPTQAVNYSLHGTCSCTCSHESNNTTMQWRPRLEARGAIALMHSQKSTRTPSPLTVCPHTT